MNFEPWNSLPQIFYHDGQRHTLVIIKSKEATSGGHGPEFHNFRTFNDHEIFFNSLSFCNNKKNITSDNNWSSYWRYWTTYMYIHQTYVHIVIHMWISELEFLWVIDYEARRICWEIKILDMQGWSLLFVVNVIC